MNDPSRSSNFPLAAIDALQRGNKIEAIKILRQERNLDLKDSKDQVEAYVNSQPELQRKMEVAQAETREGLARWLVIFLVIAAAAAYVYLQGK